MGKLYLPKLAILIAIQFLFTQRILAQNRTVTGTVSDQTGKGIPGVNVTEKGTNNATQTNSNGVYRLTVADNATLVFSSVGYSSIEVPVAGKTSVDASLTASAANLSEIVVVGYGTTRKRDLTGAVAQVKSSEFNQGNITNPLQQLQGKAAGVVITPAGGDPTGTPSVRIRGLTSLLGTGEPLYVIDGIVGADINAVSPNDIETIDILKDASSSAIYGARGANGVILITTKKGRAGRTRVEYNGYVASDWLAKKLPMLSGPEYKAAYLASGRSASNLIDKGANTDWQDEITRNALSQNHNVAFSGGSDRSNYRASVTYIGQEGIVINSKRDYLNGRIQMNQKAIKDKVNVGLSLAYTNQKKNFIDYNDPSNQQAPQENPFIYALNYSPLLPVYNTEGTFFNIPSFSYQNPVASILQNTNDGDENLINASYKVDYELFRGFTLSTFGSILRFNNSYGKYAPTDAPNGLASFNSNGTLSTLGKGNARRNTDQGTDKLINVLGNFRPSISLNNNLDITAGYEYYDNVREGFGTSTSGFISNAFSYNNLGGANILTTSDISSGSYKNSYQLASFLGRINYGYRSRYLLTLNGRYDGSSKLGKNNKWGFFPSAAVSWVISEESFLKNNDLLNQLKLRVGYGETGNVEPIAPYNSLLLYGPSGSYYANGQFNRAYSPSQINNEDLKWERRVMTNVGLDFAVLRNKLYGTIEYYSSKTKDLLYNYGLPSPPLPFSTVLANAGSLTNKGMDITLNAGIVKNKRVSWNTTLIFGTVKNEITSLKGSFTYAGQTYELNTPKVPWGVANGQGLNQNVTYLEVGHPFAAFFIRHFNGTDANGKQVLVPADASSDDRVWIDPWNDFTYGWSNFVNFGNFDFNMQIRGQYGGKVFNNTYLNFANVNRFNNNANVHEDALTNGITDPAQTSDYALQSSSFARLESASLGYTIKTTSSVISRLRVYVAGNNLFIITKYKGYDPEVRVSGKQAFIDNLDYYPRSRSVSFGINLSFE